MLKDRSSSHQRRRVWRPSQPCRHSRHGRHQKAEAHTDPGKKSLDDCRGRPLKNETTKKIIKLQELRTLFSVTLSCQVTMVVRNSGPKII